MSQTYQLRSIRTMIGKLRNILKFKKKNTSLSSLFNRLIIQTSSQLINGNYKIKNDILYKNSSGLNSLEMYLRIVFKNNIAGSTTIIIYLIIILFGIIGNFCIIAGILSCNKRSINRKFNFSQLIDC